MLFSLGPDESPVPCSFNPDLNCASTLKCNYSKEKVFRCSDFGGWIDTSPRKRKIKLKSTSLYDAEAALKNKSEKNQMKLLKSDTYYKRYRVDPLAGTFKHYQNHWQYIKLYRETTTLCYKQRTLQEITSLYSAALDINTDRGHSLNGYTYNLDLESCGKWDLGNMTNSQPDFIYTNPLNIPPITSRSENGIPLMLLPHAPSIPSRIMQQQTNVSSPIAQASFMCNAHMNRHIVCPVHRLIHRKTNGLRSKSSQEAAYEHVKVTLPGIPKRRYNLKAAKLNELRKSHPLLGVESTNLNRPLESRGQVPPNSKGTTPTQLDEEEDMADSRIDNLLLATPSNASPSDRISKALSHHKRIPVPTMQLPVTALLQYSPNQPADTRNVKVSKKPFALKSRQSRFKTESKKEAPKPKPDIKQLNYEKEYERFFSDVLESTSKSKQRKHFRNLSNKL